MGDQSWAESCRHTQAFTEICYISVHIWNLPLDKKKLFRGAWCHPPLKVLNSLGALVSFATQPWHAPVGMATYQCTTTG